MNLRNSKNRVLDPLERFSEIVFGLIMVLSFTCAISVAQAAPEDLRAMIIGAIGCNLAWGIIDAVFYLIACLTEQGHNAALLRAVQKSNGPEEARRIIEKALPPSIAAAWQESDFERIQAHLVKLPPPSERPRLTGENLRGALGVLLLVFLSTFPVVVPFFIFQNPYIALRVSNGVAIILLFGAGTMLANYGGLRRGLTGLVMVAIGAAFVALTIALGG